MESVSDRIINVMSNVFGVNSELINSDTSQDTLKEWDSVSHLNLIVALEEEFSISIPMDDIGVMTNFKLVEAVVKEQLV